MKVFHLGKVTIKITGIANLSHAVDDNNNYWRLRKKNEVFLFYKVFAHCRGACVLAFRLIARNSLRITKFNKDRRSCRVI